VTEVAAVSSTSVNGIQKFTWSIRLVTGTSLWKELTEGVSGRCTRIFGWLEYDSGRPTAGASHGADGSFRQWAESGRIGQRGCR
jgi:hypothetical protein